MSYHNDPYNNAGDYSNTRRRSLQPLESQQELTEPPAPPNTVNVNQEIAHHYAAYRPQASIDESTTYYSTGTSNPGHYGTAHQYQQEHGSGYHPHTQGAMTIPYPPGQSARDVYSQHGVNAQWTSGHHYPSVDFHRSASWPPQHIGHSGLPMPLHGSTSMIQTPNNNRGRRQVVVPQRSYIPHHRQNYFDQFTPEDPITFPSYRGDGIPLVDVMNENFDHLVGRDDPMFAKYLGPAISLRLEWPGYKSWTKQIKTKDWRREPKPITKAKLANEVAKKVQNFIQDNINELITPGSERWKVGPGFIEAKDLVLVRLVHVSKGSWQAEFRAFE